MRYILILCFISIGYVSAQYQGDYEGNVNPYPRSQYDSGENNNYSPPSRPAQSYPPARSSQASYSKPKASNNPKSHKLTPEEEEAAAAAEEEKKPSELELLLANSKFSCGNLKDGYYADNSVNCQVFHYCVGGAKHSWMCPANTKFHQVHLNCVPDAQDICTQSEKYHIVNDYLYKPIEQSLGPNKTVRYHQRYYPDEFLGDPSAPSNEPQSYPPAAPSRPSSNSYNSYEDETPISYRPQPSRSNSKPPSYSNYPQSYSSNKPVASSNKPKSSYSNGNYPVSLISSPQPSRKPAPNYDSSYEEGSYRSAPPTYNQPSAVRSQPGYSNSNKPSYKQQNSGGYQSYSAAASSPAYKPSAAKPAYSANNYPSNQQTRPSAGYESNNYSGVTYENEDY